MNGTVKQFKDALNEMKLIYPFDDSKTFMSTRNFMSNSNDYLQIITTDEKSGIKISMEKLVYEAKPMER